MIKSELQQELIELCREILDTWSVQDQLGMAYEEMGELISALNQYRRGRNEVKDVLSEVVDVYIILHQLVEIFVRHSGHNEEQINDLLNNEMAVKFKKIKDRIAKTKSEMGL